MSGEFQQFMREAQALKQERAELLPTEQDCIDMMVQCRLRLLDLGWKSGENAPRDGSGFTGINAGFAGPAEFRSIGNGYFMASPGDWWPVPRPLVFKEPV